MEEVEQFGWSNVEGRGINGEVIEQIGEGNFSCPTVENLFSSILQAEGLAQNNNSNNQVLRLSQECWEIIFDTDDRVLDDDVDDDDDGIEEEDAQVSQKMGGSGLKQQQKSAVEDTQSTKEDAQKICAFSPKEQQKSTVEDTLVAKETNGPSLLSKRTLPTKTKTTTTTATTSTVPKVAKTSKKHATIETLRQEAKEFHLKLTSESVACALFPDGSAFKTKLNDIEVLETNERKKSKSAWERCINAVSASFVDYGLEVDFNCSPHFYPTNYNWTQAQLAVKIEAVDRQKKEGKKKKDPKASRQWPQQSFADSRKVYWQCCKCKTQLNKVSVVAVGKCFYLQESQEYGVAVDQVFYHDSNCCTSKAGQSDHYKTFSYNHDSLFKGMFDKTASDLEQFTAENPEAVPDGVPLATSATIRYDDRMFVDLPLRDDIPQSSFWRNSIDTNSVEYKQFLIRLGYCLSSKMDLSKGVAPFVLDFDTLRATDTRNPCGARQTVDIKNPDCHLFIWNAALLLGGMSTSLTMFDKKVIHQFCHTDAGDIDAVLEDPDHPLSQVDPSTAMTIPSSFEMALQDNRQIYVNHPDFKTIKAERKTGGDSVGLYFDNLCWHGGMTETNKAVGADKDGHGPNRKWRLTLHGHLDSIYYDRNPDSLGLPTLGHDGALYVLPEHSAIRNTQAQAAKDLIFYAKSFATMIDLLKKGNREKVLAKIPIRAVRILEEEYAGLLNTGSDRK